MPLRRCRALFDSGAGLDTGATLYLGGGNAMTDGPVILVCGGRDYQDRAGIYQELDKWKPSRVVTGDARGADLIAREWCAERSVPWDVCHADWDHQGKAAGPIRNRAMVKDGGASVVFAFAGGRGTQSTIEFARLAGLPVWHFKPSGASFLLPMTKSEQESHRARRKREARRAKRKYRGL